MESNFLCKILPILCKIFLFKKEKICYDMVGEYLIFIAVLRGYKEEMI